jgi:hypothetical protein
LISLKPINPFQVPGCSRNFPINQAPEKPDSTL